MIDDFNLQQIVKPLLQWFEGHARVLPWRENPRPYYVWISEIMLQQTRVEAVKPYFDRFLSALPDVKSLAECPDDELMKLWEGLGYYNRARNLKVAANQIMDEWDGELPSEYEQLLMLKGIGHYTAGAIASIAYGRPVPAVDGNVLRVISRVTADDSDIMKQSVRTHMEDVLRNLMQESVPSPSKFNQALMELGATVCVPNGEPHCMECPWQEMCQARLTNRIGEIPVKKKSAVRRLEDRTVLILRDGDTVALRKRPDTGLLAGLYELPNVDGKLTEDQVLSYVKKLGYAPIRIKRLREAKHIFSHIEWHMIGYAVLVEEAELKEDAARPSKESAMEYDSDSISQQKSHRLIFVDADTAERSYAIPAAFAKYAEYLNIELGVKKDK